MSLKWTTEKILQESPFEMRVTIDAAYFNMEDINDPDVEPCRRVLAVYFDDDIDASLTFDTWTEEMEKLSFKTYRLINKEMDKVNAYGRKVGEKTGEERIVEQVHRLLGVDQVVNALRAGLGEQY